MHKSRDLIGILVGAAVVLALVLAAAAEQVVVTTRDGRQHRGELVSEDEQAVTLTIAGVKTTFDRDQVSKVDSFSVAEEYRRRREGLSDDDLKGRYELAKWLVYAERSYELAQTELADLAKGFPDNEEISRLQRIVSMRLKLRSNGTVPQAPPADKSGQKDPDKKAPGDEKDKSQLLTKEQINIIRVYEIDLDADRPPRVLVSRDVAEEFLKTYAEEDERLRGRRNQSDFIKAPGYRKLQLMFDLKAREFYPKVKVARDPASLGMFRKSIHRQYVLSHCGNARCHGREDAEGFALFARRAADEATIYTNFYLLHKYKKGEGFMIDRDRPEQSYLVQYGLPRVDAQTPHPDVKGWTPKFRKGRDDRVYRTVIDWIEMLYDNPTPEYPIEYPPGGDDDDDNDDSNDDNGDESRDDRSRPD